MSKRPFSKPHFTYAQQRKKLQQQGMIIDMLDQQAEHYLAHFNYYRFPVTGTSCVNLMVNSRPIPLNIKLQNHKQRLEMIKTGAVE